MRSTNAPFSLIFTLFVIVFYQGLFQCQVDNSYIDRVKEQDQIEKSIFHYFEKRSTRTTIDASLKRHPTYRERSTSPGERRRRILKELEVHKPLQATHNPGKLKQTGSRAAAASRLSSVGQENWQTRKPMTHGLPESGRSIDENEAFHGKA